MAADYDTAEDRIGRPVLALTAPTKEVLICRVIAETPKGIF